MNKAPELRSEYRSTYWAKRRARGAQGRLVAGSSGAEAARGAVTLQA
jgi:hypothetical protein